MKNSKILIVVIISFFSIGLLNAQILTVQENDRGELREIKTDDKQILEINSKVEVNIEKEELLSSIKDQYPQFARQVDLDAKIALFDQALSTQTTILNILDQEMPSVDDREQFYDLILNFLTVVQENEDLKNRYLELNADFRAKNPPGTKTSRDRRAFIFLNLNNDLSEFRNALNTLEAQKYSISLLAFKKDDQGGDRVHVQNFDTYTERDYFTVERWVVNLSDDQKQKLSDLTTKANENNEKALSIFDDLKQQFKINFPSVNCIGEQKDALTTFINDPEITTELTDAVKSKANAIISDIDNVRTFIEDFNIDFGTWDITTPFELEDQFNSLMALVKNVTEEFESFDEIVGAVDNIVAEVGTLSSGFQSCFKDLKDEFDNLKTTIPLLINQQKNYILNKEIGEEVIAFSTDNLPNTGYINLKGSGPRKNGDELVLEVVLRIPSSQDGLPEQTIMLEQRSFVMLLIGVRSETTVGMIMANPKGDFDSDTDRKFYFAPSAALLLKFGSRNSYFYNDFIDIGIGVNFAAPDFDTDGTPEFGLGLMVTVFKDVLSAGYNYNVTLDDTYWFFGVNLPFNLPGLPVNPIKN